MTRAILLAVLGTLLCPGVSLADPVSTVRITDSGLPLSGGTLTGSITAPNVTATSTVSGATVTASGTVSGSTVSATTLTGTLSTAAQPNVTSVGTLSSLTLGGTLDLGMFALKDPGNIYRLQATTDAAPIGRSFSAQAAFEQATGANQVGASRTLAGGIGTRQITTFNSGATGADTYTGTVTDQTPGRQSNHENRNLDHADASTGPTATRLSPARDAAPWLLRLVTLPAVVPAWFVSISTAERGGAVSWSFRAGFSTPEEAGRWPRTPSHIAPARGREPR